MPKLPRLAGRSCEGCAYAAGNVDGACRLLRRRVTPPDAPMWTPCPASAGLFFGEDAPSPFFSAHDRPSSFASRGLVFVPAQEARCVSEGVA